MTTDKYLIFGTGTGCEDFLSNADVDDFDSILGFIDNNKDKQGTFFKGKKIFSFEETKELEYNKIIIASVFYNEIKEKLIAQGIAEKKITCSVRNFTCSNFKQLVFLDKEKHKLKNKKISIISNYCWGLFLYKFLNLEYCSPLVGCYIDNENYEKLIGNLKYYLAQPLKTSLDPTGIYTIAELDDVTLHFWHEHFQKELKIKWEKRLERVDFNNLFMHYGNAIMHNIKEDKAYQMIEIKNKLTISQEASYLYSDDKKIITTNEPVDLIKWFNKEL